MKKRGKDEKKKDKEMKKISICSWIMFRKSIKINQ